MPCHGLARCSGHDHNNGPAAAGRQQQPGHHAHKGLAVDKPRCRPAQVLVHDSWCLAGSDAAYSAWHFRFLTFPPCPASWARMAFTLAIRGAWAQASGNTWAAPEAETAMASRVGGGQGGWNHYHGGHCHLGGQMSPQHWGDGGGGSNGGGREGKNDCGAADNDIPDVAAGRGRRPAFMLREEQIEQFAYFIRGGEAAVGDERLQIQGRVQSNNGRGNGRWQRGQRQK